MKKISFVFPVYNEEQGLDKLYSEMSKISTELEKKYIVEFICINDGSKDRSFEKLQEIHNRDKRFHIINLSRNFGQQMAITAGFDFATGDAIIVMDSDLQDPPEVALQLVRKWEEGFEVVYAQRRKRKDPFIKKSISFFFYRILDRLTDIKIPKDTGEFRLIDKKVLTYINRFREKNRFFRGIFTYVGFKQTAVLFDKAERFAGKAKFTFGKSLKLAMDGITGFSTVPLKLITQFGLWVSLFSFLGIIYAIAIRLFHPEWTVSGTTFIVISVLFIGGVQMIMLGILGTYIGRIYSEVQNRPLYIISSILSDKEEIIKNEK